MTRKEWEELPWYEGQDASEGAKVGDCFRIPPSEYPGVNIPDGSYYEIVEVSFNKELRQYSTCLGMKTIESN